MLRSSWESILIAFWRVVFVERRVKADCDLKVSRILKLRCTFSDLGYPVLRSVESRDEKGWSES